MIAFAAVLLSLPAMPVHSADAAAPGVTAPAVEEEEVLDEVVVQGTKLWKLREAVVDAEERFYSLYNELNKDKDFDVTCRMEAPLGTRLKKRGCHISFMEDAQAEYAQAMVIGSFAPDPNQVWVERMAQYRDNARKLLTSHPELLKLAEVRARAEKKYNDERKKRFKGRWILFE